MANLVQLLRRSRTEQRHSISTIDDWFNYLGHQYPLGMQTTMPGVKQEDIPNSFTGYSTAFKSNPVIFGLEQKRVQVFSQMRFKYRRLSSGELFGDPSLRPLERPWSGGTSRDLLARSLLFADLAGNDYTTAVDGRLRKLRPDWTSIVLGSNTDPDDPGWQLDATVLGYAYKPGGRGGSAEPQFLRAQDVAHFAPMPDPDANFRGMSWLTPVLRELKGDNAATAHKLAFFENAATPNVAVSLDASITPDDFKKFVDQMDEQHKGTLNAWKTLYTAGGADVTVIGASLKDLDYKAVQGAGETRLALAAGVHPVVAGISEGMQGSSLNAGNYGQARRQFSDMTLQDLWSNAAASFEPLVRTPAGAELWFDPSHVPFLQDDMKDKAEIQQAQAVAIRALTDAGYESESVVAAVTTDDMSKLKHTGLFSVQLQAPGQGQQGEGDG